MKTNVLNTFQSTITSKDHPYLFGAWTPVHEEVHAVDMDVIGDIPKDLNGVYIRNTENPVHEPLGLYHPFDGDGMIHAMSFTNGEAVYRNKFIRTDGFKAEQEAGRALWAGLAGNPALSERPGWGAHGSLKDSSSTDVVVHAGDILSTFYQCGEGYQLDPYTLDTHGKAEWVPPEGISAHPKVDPFTGDLMFFNYSKHAPYMHYGVVGKDKRIKHFIPIELPGPRLPHDMAFSKNYSILIDMPMFWDPELLKRDIHAVRFYPDIPMRFAIVPRFGSATEIRWFEADPTYVLHWGNAVERGNEIVLEGYYQENPQPRPLEMNGEMDGIASKYGQLMAYVDEHSFQPKLHRWIFNLDTGKTREERLDDRVLEFGTFNQDYCGRESRYLYSTTTKPGWFLFNGLVKHDLQTGDSTQISFGDERYGSEAPFAPRDNAESEDDGYLISFITDMKADRSECIVLDAQNIDAGPVCRIILPHRISSGVHATWASHHQIKTGVAA